MKVSTAAKILGTLGSFIGGTILVMSDDPKAEKFRNNLGGFVGTITGYTMRAMRGNDITYNNRDGWKIQPHGSIPTVPKDTSSCVWPLGVDDFIKLSPWNRDDYVRMIERSQAHELKMRELEVRRLELETNLKYSEQNSPALETMAKEESHNASGGESSDKPVS